jgi:Protein of unknown function (DUF1592)/Protein of unknown function (DUF1588)/Protein of unknown function (DUF1595)/Protein of unknown function (DUF1587)/Protein of unknown function (DUF1585)
MQPTILRAIGCAALLSSPACQGVIDASTDARRGANHPPGTTPGGGAGGGSTTPGGVVDKPVHVALRRLTRAQYDNTVRDLLGIDTDPAQDFGLDEEDGGFASNDRAPVESLQVERYQTAAEGLASKAVANLTTLAPCAPPKGTEAACLDDFLHRVGRRAYRRPLTSDEIASYTQLFAVGKGASGDFKSGLELVIGTLLQSPHFLYRPELGDSAGASEDGWPLTPYETASRLSFFLQNTMPDDEMLDAAETGKLVTVDDVAFQARRLLDGAKVRDTLVSFHEQWLEMEGLSALEKDMSVYPEFTPEVRTAMQDELRELADYIIRQGDARLETLLTANFSFLRPPLYSVYGLPAPQGTSATDPPARVTLPAGQRAGVMTLASVMAEHGHPDQSSLVKRGYMVLDKLLCTVPPPPPPNVDNTVPKPDPNVSTRVRFAQHRADAKCKGCHDLMDPLGIAFEIYDGMGRFRKTDGGKPVDATSALAGTDRDGPVKDAVELMGRLAKASQVRTCMATQWFRYAFGRADTADDEGIVATALDQFARADYRIPDLMVGLATTKAFRHRPPVQP